MTAGPEQPPEPAGRALTAFSDLRVIELGLWMAAPAATALLADLGAEVIKIEPPQGDPGRTWFAAIGGDGKVQPTFALDNRRKKSLALDLSAPEGRDRLDQLLAGADVLVTNMRLPTLERLHLTAREVSAAHPHLIYGSITAYGLEGPDASLPGYDVGAFWARSSLSHQLAGRSPLHAPGAYGDHFTGFTMFAAILAGLLERQKTGRGGIVETSLLQSGAWLAGPDLAVQATLGKVHAVAPREDAPTPLVNSYRAGDGQWFFLTCLEVERHFAKVATVIDRPELISDPRFQKAHDVRKYRRELIAMLDEAFAEAPLDEWAKRFKEADIWWQKVQTPAEILADPQLPANGWLEDVAIGPDQVVPMITSPIKVFGHQLPGPAAAPAFDTFLQED